MLLLRRVTNLYVVEGSGDVFSSLRVPEKRVKFGDILHVEVIKSGKSIVGEWESTLQGLPLFS